MRMGCGGSSLGTKQQKMSFSFNVVGSRNSKGRMGGFGSFLSFFLSFLGFEDPT